jgi:type VI secretion system protein VasD
MIQQVEGGFSVYVERGTLPQVVTLALLAELIGCASPPPPPAPTIVELKLSTTPDTNSTESGQGAPIGLRIYQLSSRAAFESAEFHRLYDADAAALGADLVKEDSYLLPPGSTKSVTLMPSDQVHAIGVLAAYREFQTKTWRAIGDILAHQTTIVTIKAAANGVMLGTARAQPTPER